MPTNKQDKRDGPTTEEQKPYPGTPNPCALLPLLRLFFLYDSLPLFLSLSPSPSLLRTSHLSSHFSALPLPLFLALSPSPSMFLISHPPLFWINARSFAAQKRKEKRERSAGGGGG